MRKFFLCALLLLCGAVFVYGQTPGVPITSEKKAGRNRYYQNNQHLRVRELKILMKDNSQALDCLNTATVSDTFSKILGYTGGFMVGFFLGDAIAGDKFKSNGNDYSNGYFYNKENKPLYWMLGVGAGAIVIGAILSPGYNKNTSKAVKLYNDGLLSQPSGALGFPAASKPRAHLASASSGLGLAWHF